MITIHYSKIKRNKCLGKICFPSLYALEKVYNIIKLALKMFINVLKTILL